MKKRVFSIIATLIAISCLIFTSGCDVQEPYDSTATYTVIWKNWDGSVLETDENVERGTLPNYDGQTPTKDEDDDYTYEFVGWDKPVIYVTCNVVYTAVFNSVSKGGKLNIGDWDEI